MQQSVSKGFTDYANFISSYLQKNNTVEQPSKKLSA
jgi:hypothetical protein